MGGLWGDRTDPVEVGMQKRNSGSCKHFYFAPQTSTRNAGSTMRDKSGGFLQSPVSFARGRGGHRGLGLIDGTGNASRDGPSSRNE